MLVEDFSGFRFARSWRCWRSAESGRALKTPGVALRGRMSTATPRWALTIHLRWKLRPEKLMSDVEKGGSNGKSGCLGPVNDALERPGGETLFLIGYKLAPGYQDRKRNPPRDLQPAMEATRSTNSLRALLSSSYIDFTGIINKSSTSPTSFCKNGSARSTPPSIP